MSPERTRPATLSEVMAQALAIERDAAERYSALADVMEVHNNREVTELFRKMASIEARHMQQIMSSMGWGRPEDAPPVTGWWPGGDAPESVPQDEIHYLMTPWHALQLALGAEQRAEAFFAALATNAPTEAVRKAALEMRDEEREHVALIRNWLAKVPRPDEDWAVDPDPPRYLD
ncbi:MAG TPA: ferritin family protein [Burkholderiaceae bacterium]|nr:ferritin family protein [Burkholderiaceae bacterium]